MKNYIAGETLTSENRSLLEYMKTIIKRINGTGLMLLALALSSSCMKNSEKMYTETIDGLFDTTHVISGYDMDEKKFMKKVEFYKKEMERLHNLYTIHENIEGINNIKTINDNAGIKPVKVDGDIIVLLKDSIKWNREISSNVNIAAGKIIDLWEKGRKENKLPDTEDLEEAKKCSNIDDIIINEKESTVFLKRKCMMLNVGAVAKGYAVEIASDKMKKEGMDSLIISAGGNVMVIGKRKVPRKENGKSDLRNCRHEFCIGIASPIYNNEELDKNNIYNKKENSYISKVAVSDMSVVTTGNYQRYFYLKGKVYGHIINLETLYPSDMFASITILTENSGFADFMSTALFMMSYEEGKKLIEKIGTKEKIEVIWAMKTGDIESSDGLVNGENYVEYDFK